MKKEKKPKKTPTCLCHQCKKKRPAYGFTILSFEDGKPALELCSECNNLQCALSMGVKPPEHSYFPPVSFFDSIGKEHSFRFEVRLSTGLGITAFELDERDDSGYSRGYQFSTFAHPETPVMQLYNALLLKIKEGLSVRYLESSDFPDSYQNRIYIKGNAVNGRLEENKQGPIVVVDGVALTWEQFGKALSSYTGFSFRLECFEDSEEVEIAAKVERPDALWWLGERPSLAEADREFH